MIETVPKQTAKKVINVFLRFRRRFLYAILSCVRSKSHHPEVE